MGLLSHLFHKNQESKTFNKEVAQKRQNVKGNVTVSKCQITGENISDVEHCFIAFDTETTGTSYDRDVIIEVGAVKFVDGKIVDTYGSLINEGVAVPPSATRVNHITTAMLQKDGKDPSDVYKGLVDFFGEAMNGKICICAHNAVFDMSFLKPALENYGYSGNISYIDTLSLSRQLMKELPDHKQTTIMTSLGISNPAAHRAASDAEVCGKILLNLLNRKKQAIETEEKAKQEAIKKAQLSDNERYVFAIILNGMKKSGVDISKLCAYRNASGYVDLVDVVSIFKFKIAKKKAYVLIPKKYGSSDMKIEPAVKSEGGDDYIRVLFESPFELEQYTSVFEKIYYEERMVRAEFLNQYEAEFLAHANLTKLTEEEIISSIDEAKDYVKQKENEKAQVLKQEKEKNVAEELKQKEIEQKKKEKAADKEKEEELMQILHNSDATITDEAIQKLIDFSQKHGKRAVLQMDDDGHILKAYASLTDASKAANISPKTIRDAANGKYKHGSGFCWMFADEKELSSQH